MKKNTNISLLSASRFVKILDDYIEKGGEFSKSSSNIAVHRLSVKDTLSGIHLTVETSTDKIAINATLNSTGGEDLENEASVTVPGSILNSTDNTTLIVVYYRTSILFAPEYRRTEVCEDSFTTEKVSKVERSPPSSHYTMENSTGDVVTESSPVLAASLRKKHVANLTSPIIIKFQMPPDQVSYQVRLRLVSFLREKRPSHRHCTPLRMLTLITSARKNGRIREYAGKQDHFGGKKRRSRRPSTRVRNMVILAGKAWLISRSLKCEYTKADNEPLMEKFFSIFGTNYATSFSYDVH